MKQKKRHIFRKILILILIVIAVIFMNKQLIRYKGNKVIDNVEKIKSEEEIIVIVDINPSIALKVKNGTVIDSICLNKDCNDLLDKMNYTYDDNLNNRKLDTVINEIYKASKEHDYDTSNGINVSSTSSSVVALVKDVKEVTYNHITVKEEEDVLASAGVELNVSKITKDEYNHNLLEEFKKDPDYGKTYTCDIYDGEVKCYMVGFMDELMNEFGKQSLLDKLSELEFAVFEFRNLLKKFDFQYELNSDKTMKSITLGNGMALDYTDKCHVEVNNGNNETVAKFIIVNCMTYGIYIVSDTNELLADKTYYIPFGKVDLLSKTIDKKDIVFVDNTTENPIVIYGI